MNRPWGSGVATGLGSLPGTDAVEASRWVVCEVGDLPYLPELPARGLGADMVGRTASLLVDLPVEWQPHGWTVTARAGREAGAARDWLRRDLDALTERAQDAPVVKVQVCGPVTLGAELELPNLHKLLTDHGAFADLTASLAEGLRLHLAELARRLPGTAIVLQVDEPSLPLALAGRIPTPSGYGTVRSLERAVAEPALAAALAAAEVGHRVVHCCAPNAPVPLFVAAGASAVAVDAGLLELSDLDALGEFVEAGGSLWLGVVPGTDAPISVARVVERVQKLWNVLGFPLETLPDSVVPTPVCGLAGASPTYARRATAILREAAGALRD